MKDYRYLLEHFFTHKDFLVPADQMPGTLFTPLHFAFAAVVFLAVVSLAIFVTRKKERIKPAFVIAWAFLVVFEVVIVVWESVSGKTVGFDLQTNLSLYPCSMFLYIMPIVIWGKGTLQKMACGTMCTLELLGASVNFFYPAIRLSEYSCISFPGFHTFIYHGTMLFVCLVILISGYHRYTGVRHWWELFQPCVLILLMSIPANIINFSPIQADYMYFRWQFPLLRMLFPNVQGLIGTAIIYGLYIFVPALFYLPSYIRQKFRQLRSREQIEAAV